MAVSPSAGGVSSDLVAAICTRNRPELVRRALHSLMSQVPPLPDILVVDNAPANDATRSIVEQAFPTARYVREPVPGLDFARNRALRESRHEIVAFLDDDAVADPGWAESLLDVFRKNPRAAAVTGRIEPLAVETEAQALFEANGGFSRGLKPIRLPADSVSPLHGGRAPLIAWAVSIGCGCSFALRREPTLAIGGFDEALDLSPILPGGGDLDILWRLLDGGYEIHYQPEVLAWHEHRREMDAVIRQLAGHQRALLAMLGKSLGNARSADRLAIMAFLGWRLVKPGVRLLRRTAGADPLPASVLLRMWWNCWIGIPAYLAARRLARRRAIEFNVASGCDQATENQSL